ncbi:hypothetical protein SNE40_009188 [Patella caerulea]|uniref:Sialin n=1 Tax=Patella caerulea TaxID=87958 RepID=A0AAN8JP35_PATCE
MDNQNDTVESKGNSERTPLNPETNENMSEDAPTNSTVVKKPAESPDKAGLLSRVKERTRTISSSSQESNASLRRRYLNQRRSSSFDLSHHNTPLYKEDLPPFPDHIDLSLVPWWTSKRLQLAVICFFGFLCLYSQRVNLSIAIVSMVDHSGKLESHDNSSNHYLNSSMANNVTTQAKCPETLSSHSSPGEFTWNKELQGLILGSFFWGYLSLQVAGGWLSERFGAKKVIAIGMFPVAILNILSPICARASPYLFIFVRVIVGIGESVMYPAAQALWARWAPPNERSRLIGLSYAGGQFGNALIFPIGGFLCHYGFDGGWPSVFYVIGSVGFIWTVIWCIFAHDSPGEHPSISTIEKDYIQHSLGVKQESFKRKHKTPWLSIFKSKAVWAIIIAHACGNYGIYMLLTQIPTYMKEVLKFDIKANGVFSMLPYLCFWLFILISGTTADFLIKREILSISKTRKIMTCIGTIVPGIFLIGTGYMECDQKMAAVAMLTIAVGVCGVHFSGHFINHSDIAPPFAGTLFGISNTVATVPGILAPYIVGAMTKNGTREEWLITFYIAAGVYTFGALIFVILGEGEVQSWGHIEHSTMGTELGNMDEKLTLSLHAIQEENTENNHNSHTNKDDDINTKANGSNKEVV